MSEILFHYEKVDPTTWSYLSSLLTIGLFFKFSRFWSVRNLDLVLLILFAPGLLMVHSANKGIREAELRSPAVVASESLESTNAESVTANQISIDAELEVTAFISGSDSCGCWA